jgi:hypothetical protein
MRRWALAATALALWVGPSTASDEELNESAFEGHVLRQLACKSDPDPTLALLFLVKHSRIQMDAGDKVDSETCWTIEPDLELAGASFSDICASAENPFLIKQFPQLYWRGPGTSAGTGLRLVTAMSLEATRDWAKRVLGEGPYQVDHASWQDGKTEVSCNNLSRN